MAHPVEDEYPGQERFPSQTSNQVDSGGDADSPVELQKSNCLILGPSGTGKTLIAKTLARVLDVPFSISDCTAFTQAGYVGEDVDVCVQRLLAACSWDVRRAETGIICLDEVDKIASAKSSSHMRDVSGEGVQQALLKILEGTTLEITSPRSRPHLPQTPSGSSSFQGGNTASPIQNFGSFGSGSSMGSGSAFGTKGEVYTIDTSNILFILCGAFNGLSKIILDRISKHSIGFNAPIRARQSDIGGVSLETKAELQRLYGLGLSSVGESPQITKTGRNEEQDVQTKRRRMNVLEFTEPSDLISFGFIPEFIGRIPVVAALDNFDEETLVRVLSEPRNSLLKQYIQLFEMSGVELRFTSKALMDIAKASMAMDTGARALRTLLERLLSDAMFEAPGSSIRHILVNSDAARFKQAPAYFARGQQDRFHSLYATEEIEWEATRVSSYRRPPSEEIRAPKNMAVNAS
ncbi:hypothetical protein TWF696_009398 [Orbilia brochopaga]|uniref:ATP-dependent Clp protease ATP-binding subunit ClpX n=1 Tax=Orbilia brochopaga TaxID=3140254 RepID=A0AAV9UGK8_9PEZI